MCAQKSMLYCCTISIYLVWLCDCDIFDGFSILVGTCRCCDLEIFFKLILLFMCDFGLHFVTKTLQEP